jgi:hypothetical protein
MTNIYKVVFFSKMDERVDMDIDDELEDVDMDIDDELEDPDQDTGEITARQAQMSARRRQSLRPSRKATIEAQSQIAAAQAAREAQIAEYEASIRRMTAARARGQSRINPKKRKTLGLSSNLGQPKIW